VAEMPLSVEGTTTAVERMRGADSRSDDSEPHPSLVAYASTRFRRTDRPSMRTVAEAVFWVPCAPTTGSECDVHRFAENLTGRAAAGYAADRYPRLPEHLEWFYWTPDDLEMRIPSEIPAEGISVEVRADGTRLVRTTPDRSHVGVTAIRPSSVGVVTASCHARWTTPWTDYEIGPFDWWSDPN
jgi:hypothetical protein